MQLARYRACRPGRVGRRSVTAHASSNGTGPSPPSVPSRPGGGATRFSVMSTDEVPADTYGDVPTVAMRPSGGAFRGLPTSAPGTAGEVGFVSFDRPGGGCTRFNIPPSSSVVIPSGPSSPVDAPSRFSRPAGGAARMFPSGVGAGNVGPTSGDGSGGSGGSSGGGGSGGSSGSGGSGSGSPADEPLGFSSLAPWALLYVGVCGGLYWVHENFIRKKPAAKPAAPAEAAPVKSCCKKAAAEKGKGGK